MQTYTFQDNNIMQIGIFHSLTFSLSIKSSTQVLFINSSLNLQPRYFDFIVPFMKSVFMTFHPRSILPIFTSQNLCIWQGGFEK